MAKKLLSLLLAVLMLFSIVGCAAVPVQQAQDNEETVSDNQSEDEKQIAIDGYYYDLESVVLYLDEYGTLPDNFITKSEARQLGWEGGPVDKYLDGAAIGGDRFGNREGQLPTAAGRSYTECDIDTLGQSSRGAKRLVFSNDGLYFYSDDHYETFSELYVTDGGEVAWK